MTIAIRPFTPVVLAPGSSRDAAGRWYHSVREDSVQDDLGMQLNGLSADRAARLRLALVRGIGPRLRQALLAEFGDAAAVLAAPPAELRRVAGVGNELSRRIAAAEQQVDVEAEWARCREAGLAVLMEADSDYPSALQRIPDPPGVLFMRGSLLAQDHLAVAVVGTRHATPYGLRVAERLGASMARAGFTVVSGMARGVDAAAHRAAVAAGGRTLAVLGSGILNLYPPEHRSLAERIAEHGALLSELPPLWSPMSGTFPQRNRLISGLSLGVVVVEAAERSGALITARHAMEQDREVFAVPGCIDSRMSRGCHQLLRDGARLVESVDDVLDELGPLVEATTSASGQRVHHPAELQLNDQEQAVLAAVGSEPTMIDEVIAGSGLPAHRVLSTISVLEMRRLIYRLSGQRVSRL